MTNPIIMKIKILYEDKDILAIDKPSGILVDLISEKYPNFLLAHRLDKETSGVMLLAKSEKAHEFLKRQFKDRAVKKFYNTVVSGHVKNDHGIINKPIGRSPADFRRRLSGRGARGEMREAITEYKVLKRFEAPILEISSRFTLKGSDTTKKFQESSLQKFTYLEVKPKTGRTHQIRVHMKYLNHPVACDSLYDPKGPCPKPFKRLALHAKSIEFKNLKGKIVKVESPLPLDFKNLFAQ